MDPSAVLAFVQVVQHGSFRGAARASGLSKSALSQRVAALEDHLGARLLSRTTRSVTLTDIGENYHREVAPAIASLQSAEALVSQLQRHPSGRLRMTAPVELGHEILGDVLARYASLYPDVNVEVVLTNRQVNMVEEGFDLAIRVGPLSDSSMIARPLSMPHVMGTFASPAYLREHGTPKLPAELRNHKCLVMTGSQTPTTWHYRVNGKRRGISVNAHMAINSFVVLREVALQGNGVARMPVRYVQQAIKVKKIRQILKPYVLPGHSTLAVYPSARNVSSAVRTMLNLLQERPWEEQEPSLDPPSF